MVNEGKNTGIILSRVSNLSEEEISTIKCKNCQKIAKNPLICNKCSKLSCAFCLLNHQKVPEKLEEDKKGDVCKCSKEDYTEVLNPKVLKVYEKLRLKCENEKCSEILGLKEILNHEKVCLFSLNLTLGNFSQQLKNEFISLKRENLILKISLMVLFTFTLASLYLLRKNINNKFNYSELIVQDMYFKFSKNYEKLNSKFEVLNDNFESEVKKIKSNIFNKNIPGLDLLEAESLNLLKWQNEKSEFLQTSTMGTTISATENFGNFKNFRIFLKIKKISDSIYIGLTPQKIHDTNGIGFFSESGKEEIALNLKDGKIYYENKIISYMKENKVKQNDVLTLVKEDNKLLFLLNGENMGLAYGKIPQVNNLYFTAFITKYGDSIELLGYVTTDE